MAAFINNMRLRIALMSFVWESIVASAIRLFAKIKVVVLYILINDKTYISVVMGHIKTFFKLTYKFN